MRMSEWEAIARSMHVVWGCWPAASAAGPEAPTCNNKKSTTALLCTISESARLYTSREQVAPCCTRALHCSRAAPADNCSHPVPAAGHVQRPFPVVPPTLQALKSEHDQPQHMHTPPQTAQRLSKRPTPTPPLPARFFRAAAAAADDVQCARAMQDQRPSPPTCDSRYVMCLLAVGT